MSKFELKHGMIFRTGGGKWGVITLGLDRKFYFSAKSWGEISCYSLDDMSYASEKYANNHLRVDEIYEGYSSSGRIPLFRTLADFYNKYGKYETPPTPNSYIIGKSVWKFAEPPLVELTLQEVANKIGIPVETLRIKDAK